MAAPYLQRLRVPTPRLRGSDPDLRFDYHSALLLPVVQ
jgi:hypothetical protein